MSGGLAGLPVLGSLIRASNECLKSRDAVMCAIFETSACCEFDIVSRPQLGRGWSGGIDGYREVETTYLKYLEQNGKIVKVRFPGATFEVQAWDGKRHLLDCEPPAPVRTGGGTR